MIKPVLYTILFLVVVAFAIVFGYYVYNRWKSGEPVPPVTENRMAEEAKGYAYPIENFKENQTKKVFGQFITKENSPIRNDRFHGYHTGVDIEVNPKDIDKGIPVYAITNGIIRSVQDEISGYGGVIVIEHLINNQTMTAIYGHIKFFSVEKEAGDLVEKGEQIAILGTGRTIETDNERKHLHFGIHKGAEINILGYVQNKSELSGWINPNSIYE